MSIKTSQNKPTRGVPLRPDEVAFPRTKTWWAGARFERVKRGGLYTPRTGNSHGGQKEKNAKRKKTVKTAGSSSTPTYVPPVKTPRWAKKYA